MSLFGLAGRLIGGFVCGFALLVSPIASASATEVVPAPETTTIVEQTTTPEATCIQDSKSVTSHTFKGNGTAVVTVEGTLPLCDPPRVDAVRWTYMAPPTQWSQNNPTSSGIVVVQNPGTYTIVAPGREPGNCHQWDIYAEVGKNPVYPGQLDGSNNPFEPKFLSDFSNGPVTYSHDSESACADQMPPVGPPTADFNAQVTLPTCEIATVDVSGEYIGEADVAIALRAHKADGTEVVVGDENLNDGIQLSYEPAPGGLVAYTVFATFKDDGTGVTVLKTFSATRPTTQSCVVVPPVVPPAVIPPVATPVVVPAVVTPVAVKATPKVVAASPRVLAATGFNDQGWALGGIGAFLVVAGAIAFTASRRRLARI